MKLISLLLHPKVRQFKYSENITQNKDSWGEQNQDSPFGIDRYLTFQSESSTSSKPISFAEFLGVRISVNTVIEYRSDQKVYSEPHKGQQELAQKKNYLDFAFSHQSYISIKEWNWREKKDNQFNQEALVAHFLLFKHALIHGPDDDLIVLVVNVGVIIALEILIDPKDFVVMPHDQTSDGKNSRD